MRQANYVDDADGATKVEVRDELVHVSLKFEIGLFKVVGQDEDVLSEVEYRDGLTTPEG